MSSLPIQFVSLFAAADSSSTMRSIEFSLPEGPWQWAGYSLAVVALVTLAIVVYRKDAASLSGVAKVWLTGLRLSVIAGLIVIAINPQERTRKMSFRPSRVAVLIDTSLSMREPESAPPTGSSAAGEASPPSRSAAITELLSGTPLLDELRKQHQVGIYTFDSRLTAQQTLPLAGVRSGGKSADGSAIRPADGSSSSGKPIDWKEALRPRGLETRLGDSLRDLMRQVTGKTLAGIVVISDGDSNAGVDPSTANEVARRSKVRLISVGVGSTQKPVTLRVVNIQAPTDVHIGDAYEISAFVQGQGLAGRVVKVDLLMRPAGDVKSQPELLESREVSLREDGVAVEVTFKRTPSVTGRFEFFVRTAPVVRVAALKREENERRKTIRIVDRKTRVLIIAGGPMRDYRFVHTALYRHKGVSTDVWLQSVDPTTAGKVSQESDNLLIEFPPTAADLFEYDVVLAFDPDWKSIPAERLELLKTWVSEHSGGLILVASDVYTSELADAGGGSAGNGGLDAIRALYPVVLNSYVLGAQFDSRSDIAWKIQFTRAGQNADFLQLDDTPAASRQVWDDFDGVYRCYPTAGEKSGATVYAYFSDPRSQNDNGELPILMASQFYGSGRTFYLGSAEMWRLRSLSEEYYERFWTKLIREAAQGRLRRGTARGMLLLERKEYPLGQTVRVQANLMNPQLEKLIADAVPMEVYRPDGKPLIPAPKLLGNKSRPGEFVGSFRASLPGTYRIEVLIPESPTKELLRDSVDVVLPRLESDHTEQNAGLLTDLVRDTGGRYFTLDQVVKELPGTLPNRSDYIAVDDRLNQLWDRSWILYLLVGLLSLEWLTRKLLKLA